MRSSQHACGHAFSRDCPSRPIVSIPEIETSVLQLIMSAFWGKADIPVLAHNRH